MSIKPIDFQVMIPKTAEISKMQNDEHNKGLSISQQQTGIIQQKSEDAVNLVHAQKETQNAKIREDEEKKQKKEKKKKDKYKGRYSMKGEKKTDEHDTGFIDVRL
ncbi:MAG: hypothetical protein GX992_01670 [Clostridium sp.]|nr:hypothetical protein [Clostridium sp.]